MAKSDITFMSTGGIQSLSVVPRQTEAGATDILSGEPVKLKAAGSNYVVPLATAEPVVGTTTAVIGIAASDSDHTTSVDGTVSVFIPQPGVVYLCDANTPTNIDTQAEYNALVGDRVLLDLTAGVYTVDENAGDGATNGIYIVDLDIKEYPGKVAFTVRLDATYLAA